MFIKLYIDFGVLFSFSSALIKCSIFHMGGGKRKSQEKKIDTASTEKMNRDGTSPMGKFAFLGG